MIKKRDTEFGSLPGGIPDTGHSEYLRGKLEVRNHSSGTFTKRGNDVWAERSGRTYHGTGEDLAGGAMDYASPVSGSGMGKLSSLTGGVAKKVPAGLVARMMSLAKEAKGGSHSGKTTGKTTGKVISKYPFHGGAVDALEISDMMQRGANRARGTTGNLGALTKGGFNPFGTTTDKYIPKIPTETQRVRGSGWNPFDIVVPFQDKEVVPFQDKIPKTGGRKPSARNMIVKKIMKQRGVSLPEASRIVKAEGLY